MFRSAHTPPEIPLPLLVAGTAGVPGYNALDYFQARYPGQVFGLRQQENERLCGPNILVCNAEDHVGLERLFDQYRFASVLDSLGNCALKACELNPELAWRINVDGARNLLAQVVRHRARLVHLSVDMVFSGEKDGGYTEDEPTDPVTVYGKTMAAAEGYVLDAYPEACILRISLPMGVSLNGHAGAIDWITSRFKKGRPATLYFDEIRTPTYTDCMNLLYEVMLGNDLAGIFHAGGPQPLSLFQIAQVINRVGGYAPNLLMGTPRKAAGPIPPRAGNVCMDSTKLRQALGYDPLDPWPLDARWVPTDNQWHYRREGEPGSPARLLEWLLMNPARRCAGGYPAAFTPLPFCRQGDCCCPPGEPRHARGQFPGAPG